jgi:hypothetical protein
VHSQNTMLPPLNIAKGRGAWRSNLNHRCEFANTCPLEQAPASKNSTSFLTCSQGAAIFRTRCPRTPFCRLLARCRLPVQTPCAVHLPRPSHPPLKLYNSIMMHCFGRTVRSTGGPAEPALRSSLARSSRRTPVGQTSSAPSTICANTSFSRPRRWHASPPPASPGSFAPPAISGRRRGN